MDLGRHGSLLQGVVRDWVEREYPGWPGLAGRAALIAAVSYEAGSTVSEACEAAHEVVRSWLDHPSHQVPPHEVHAPLAS